MSKHLKQTIMLVVALVVLLGAAIFVSVSNNNNNSGKNAKQADKPVPTLYINGADAPTNAANHLLTMGERDGGTRSLSVTFKNDKPVYKGKLTKKTQQPMIKVTFGQKTTVFEQMRGTYQVLQYLKQHYDYDNYNAVGFSGGAIAALATSSDKDSSIPRMSQLISIAAGYDGVMKTNDKPNSNHLTSTGKPLVLHKATAKYPAYQDLLYNTETMPKNVKVLNIYGNSAGKGNNDGVITNVSSESLKYLVKKRTDSYQAVKVSGSDANHTGLFNHPVVDRFVERALYDKR
ncbi:alpha/beta hydrolase [Nicoliella spurrieriana]|uniref:Alpha/beta hydrolase n=1 Tax=Nicoliella spurrieriana TaxID=2925830 RepID=A0A976RRE8_9LACO|nr:alpha/beta hydrolase [Nicoliella spurrieriana]UQS86241.1 alpha/beta hydrolase [Nicoliella spurrieriana]